MGATNMSVRWDAVVKKTDSAQSSRRAPDRAAGLPEATHPAAPVEIQVWLFGMLAGPRVTNPLTLHFAEGCSLRGVIDELGRRLGPEFLRSVVSESGDPRNTCRMFLDGEPARDLATPIGVGTPTACVEMILCREIEGG